MRRLLALFCLFAWLFCFVFTLAVLFFEHSLLAIPGMRDLANFAFSGLIVFVFAFVILAPGQRARRVSDNDSDDDNMFDHVHHINPGSGAPMVSGSSGIDVTGHTFGSSIDTSWSSPSSHDPFNNNGF